MKKLNSYLLCIFTILSCVGYSQNDTIKKPLLYFSFDAGQDIPWWLFGSSRYHYLDNDNPSSDWSEVGFASGGIACDVSAKITILNGWGGIIMGNYSHNAFNATGFLSENWAIDNTENELHLTTGNFFPNAYSDINSEFGTIGNYYYYNNFSFFIGITHITSFKNATFEFHLLIGAIYLNLPALNGTINLVSLDSTNKQQTSNYTWNINSYHTALPAINMGLRIGVKVTHHVYAVLDLSAVLALSAAQFDEGNTITNSSNQMINAPNLSTWTDVDMLNATIGLEYKL